MRLVDSQVILQLPPVPKDDKELRKFCEQQREIILRWADEVDTTFAIMKRLVIPPMTETERDNLAKRVPGLVIYNTSSNKLNFWDGAAWEIVTSA